MLKTALRILAGSLILIIAVAAFGYGFMTWQNNSQADFPTNQQYQQALNASITWLDQNQEELLQSNNAILWSFINEAAKINHDVRLKRMLKKYLSRPELRRSTSINYFYPTQAVFIDAKAILNAPMAEYQKHLIFSLACDPTMAESDVIKKQMDENFCRWNPISSSCTTHQLMAVNYMQQRQCGDAAQNQQLISSLHEQIESQLAFDPRVGDVYIQRLMMLATTGAIDNIKPIWVARAMDAQLDNGAWEQFHPVIPLGGGYRLGFAYHLLGISKPTPNFHVTSQAILMLSKMQQKSIQTN